jgi:hypothetical protein
VKVGIGYIAVVAGIVLVALIAGWRPSLRYLGTAQLAPAIPREGYLWVEGASATHLPVAVNERDLKELLVVSSDRQIAQMALVGRVFLVTQGTRIMIGRQEGRSGRRVGITSGPMTGSWGFVPEAWVHPD